MLTEANLLVQATSGSLLHMACEVGSTTIVALLLTDAQCDPNVTNNQGETPLHVSCWKSNELVVQALLESGKCDPNVRTNTGDTPLHLATRIENTRIIQLLLADPQCDPNVTNNQGETPLHIACGKENVIFVKTLLETGKCDSIVQTNAGDTPLHLATQMENTQIIQLLFADPQCDPNVINNRGETPLHIACEKGNAIVVKTLLETAKCDCNVQTKAGNTPLHLAAQMEDAHQIIQLLFADPRCNPNVANNRGETPLHIALKLNNTHISFLILERGCHETYSNQDQMLTEANSLVQATSGSLLHMACEVGSTTIVQLLLSDPQCDPNVTNKQGETPLHVACKKTKTIVGYSLLDNEVIKLLLADPRSDPHAANDKGETPLQIILQRLRGNNGDTPLHTAVNDNKSAHIYLLLRLQYSDVNGKNSKGDTALITACRHGYNECVVALLSSEQYDPNVLDSEGNTALHVAIATEDMNSTKLVECLLFSVSNPTNLNYKKTSTNFNHQNAKGDTALHMAVTLNNPAIVQLLVSNQHCDPNVRNHDGNTPLSIACQLERFLVVSLLLSSGRVDPECVNNVGKTPAELTTDYLIIQKIHSLIESRHRHPIETFVKIFIIGNAETGKSTLIQAICTESSKMLKLLPASRKQVKPEDVEPHTAGIIPITFRSKHFGNTVLYDFAGQYEYYSSHAAVMENVAVPTPPAFIVVVDISEPIDKITEKLTYWWSFIQNHCERTSVPPPVILVGSHKHVVKARNESVKQRMKQILQSLALEGLPTTFHFAGHVTIDCRSLVSKGLDKLLSLLNESCKSLRKTSDVDLRCHVLYAFLTDKFQSSIACKLSEVITTIQTEDTLLPQNPAELEHLLSTLSDKGQVIVLNNTSNPEDSWIVLQKEKLLSEVSGSIFAPDNFRQFIQNFARSTGIVPVSKIQKQFQQHPLDIVIGFLSHLEFCFKISDYQTLDMIAGEWEPQSPTLPTDKGEEFYFFPALVRVEYPTDLWKQDQPSRETQKPADPPMIFQCGWFYQCRLPNQFLTSRFLHVLILRLAFKFALAIDRQSDQSPVIQRRCSAWKHGIAWLNRDGIGAVVEVGLQCRWVTVMMRCLTNQVVECVQLQSVLIKTILNTQAEFCPAVAMVQSLIHPDCLQYRMEERIRGGIVQYSFKEVAAAVIKGKPYTIDQSGNEMIEIKKLLPFEPYLGLGEVVISKLFSSEGAGREVTDKDLTELAEMAHERVELFRLVLKPVLNPSLFNECYRQNTDNPISQCKSLLKLFRDQGNRTFQDFEQHLSKYSIFCGQNPLVS